MLPLAAEISPEEVTRSRSDLVYILDTQIVCTISIHVCYPVLFWCYQEPNIIK